MLHRIGQFLVFLRFGLCFRLFCGQGVVGRFELCAQGSYGLLEFFNLLIADGGRRRVRGSWWSIRRSLPSESAHNAFNVWLTTGCLIHVSSPLCSCHLKTLGAFAKALRVAYDVYTPFGWRIALTIATILDFESRCIAHRGLEGRFAEFKLQALASCQNDSPTERCIHIKKKVLS